MRVGWKTEKRMTIFVKERTIFVSRQNPFGKKKWHGNSKTNNLK